ncbi:unnamed protein product [Ixodes pacificus]
MFGGVVTHRTGTSLRRFRHNRLVRVRLFCLQEAVGPQEGKIQPKQFY